MKQFCLILAILLLGYVQPGRAQDDQQRNKLVFEKLQGYINSKATDSLYSLLDDNFQKQFSRQTIEGVLAGNVYTMGGITDAKESAYKGGVSVYKVSYANGTQKVMIGADSNNRIYTLSFRPWLDEEKTPKKAHRSLSDNPLSTSIDKQIDTVARKYIDRLNTVGLAIGIWKNGKKVTYGYGATVKRKGSVPLPGTIFEIGSITKTFTATLLAWYAQKGKVKLSDPITKYLPDSVAANKNLEGITLLMLSNHTSGLACLPFNLDAGGRNPDPYANYDKAKMFYYLKNCKPLTTPGTKYDYSNIAVGLLGVILEQVSGKSYEDMVKQVITVPLRMNQTVQNLSVDERARFTAVYNEKGMETSDWNFQAFAGAGCLHSSVDDLLKYAAANMANDDNALFKAMSLTHEPTLKPGNIGMGWHFGGGRNAWLWHNGGTGGSSSFMAFNPEKKLAVVVLSNAAISVDDLARDIMEIAKQP